VIPASSPLLGSAAALRRGETLLALAAAFVLVLLLLPLPPPILDVLLVGNIALSLLVLFTVLATPTPREFTAFPSLLLFLTLFRLGLNVASTRLILLRAEAGQVIAAFGEFVVGGDMIVGLLIFVILVVVQFVVITKGAGRIAEVAARFTLDGLPGRQMAIDADLNAGVITPEDARKRRSELVRESEFYGAMDGASKFVRGDAIAGLVITAVNLLAGGAIGLMKGLTLGEAVRRYLLLSVGDGLVAQVPALVVSTSGALLVTKASSESPLSLELARQLFFRPRTFFLVGAATLILAAVPGLPAFPFLLLSGVLLLLGHLTRASSARAAKPLAPTPTEPAATDRLEDLLQVDRILVEVGYRLVGLVEGGAGGGLLGRIGALRRRFAAEMGVLLPPVRVRDSASLEATAYRIALHGETVATGDLVPGSFLAMSPGDHAEPLAGVVTKDPTFGLPALWAREELREEAESKGYTVVETSAVLATHLAEVLREHSHEILSRDDVQTLLDSVRKASPAVVEGVVPSPLSLGDVHRVLRNLLRERVSIRNLVSILEALGDHAPRTKDPDVLTEFVRERLARSLSTAHADREGVLTVITLDPTTDRGLAEAGPPEPGALGPRLRAVAECAAEAARATFAKGKNPVLLTRPSLRRVLALALEGFRPRVPVLAFSEVVGVRKMETAAVVRLPHET